MQTLEIRIFSNGSVEIEVDGTAIKSGSELDELVKNFHNEEIDSQVYYDDKLVTLYSMQGGIGAKGIGFIAPLLFNPLANLLLALCKE